MWTGDVNNIDVFDEIINILFGRDNGLTLNRLRSKFSLFYCDMDEANIIPMSLIPDLESSPPDLKCLFQGQYINKNQEIVSLSSTITYTMDETGNMHCNNITPIEATIIKNVESEMVKSIQIVDTLPEVEEDGVLYLVKEQELVNLKENGTIVNYRISESGGVVKESIDYFSLLLPCSPLTTYKISRTILSEHFRACCLKTTELTGDIPYTNLINNDTGTEITITTESDTQALLINYFLAGDTGSSQTTYDDLIVYEV